MRSIIAALAGAWLAIMPAAPVRAQAIAVGAACGASPTKAQVVVCLRRTARARELELAALWEQVAGKLSREEAAAYRAEDAAWRSRRDAGCNPLLKQPQGRLAYYECLEDQTRARLEAVRDAYWWRVERDVFDGAPRNGR
jgi:uncharacterized protein YecT (DUF1311 family)